MPGFVVEYNRRSRDWKVTEYVGPNGHRDALKRRLELEHARTDDEWEIASLNSDSFDTIRRTHARYFEGHELEEARIS